MTKFLLQNLRTSNSPYFIHVIEGTEIEMSPIFAKISKFWDMGVRTNFQQISTNLQKISVIMTDCADFQGIFNFHWVSSIPFRITQAGIKISDLFRQ